MSRPKEEPKEEESNKKRVGDDEDALDALLESVQVETEVPIVLEKYILVNTVYVLLLSLLVYVLYSYARAESSQDALNAEQIEYDDAWHSLSVEEKMWAYFSSPRPWKIASVVGTAMVGFGIIHLIARAAWKRWFPRYRECALTDRIALAERLCSTIHSLIVGVWSLNLVFVERVWQDDVIMFYPSAVDWVLAVSIGYELYDMVCMALQASDPLEMWVHHIVMCVGYVLCMMWGRFAFIAIIMLITELTVVPSNFHWYLKILDAKVTRAFHFNQGLRLWSFIFIRLWIVPYIFYRIYLQSDQFVQEDLVTIVGAVSIPTLLGALNAYWVYQLATLYRRRVRLRDQQQQLLAKKYE
jgi:TLC domain